MDPPSLFYGLINQKRSETREHNVEINITPQDHWPGESTLLYLDYRQQSATLLSSAVKKQPAKVLLYGHEIPNLFMLMESHESGR